MEQRMSATEQEAKQAQPSRADRLRDFDHLPNDALIAISTAAAVRGVSESTEWATAKADPEYPRLLKLSPRCTRVQVGAYRLYLRVKAGEATR
jgi:hypothetical protein